MTTEDALAELARIAVEWRHDIEVAHERADQVLLAVVPTEIRDAWQKIGDDIGGFWYA